MNEIVLFPGWGLGVAPLLPLADALRNAGRRVTIVPLPDLRQPLAQVLDGMAKAIPAQSWLIGWSLGGMLAAELAGRADVRCAGLVTLGANMRFVATQDWPDAMPVATFGRFREGCGMNPEATLKRFSLLCSQGASDARALSRVLSESPDPSESLLAGLDVLAGLEMRRALEAFEGPRLHVFAGRDALVPASAATALARVSPVGTTALMAEASHAFVTEQAEAVANLIVSRVEAARVG
ncbi:alpha/beta fold hydrolase [Pseudomonas sp. Marseille-QA0892]